MRFLLSAAAAVVASLALGPMHSGIALAYANDLVVPRFLSPPRRARYAGGSGFPAPTTDRGELFRECAQLKRDGKNARRAELAA